MEFDTNGFITQKFADRHESVEVSGLKLWFKDLKDGEKPVWVVRNLSGSELAVSTDAALKQKNLSKAIEAVVGIAGQHTAQAAQELLGLKGPETPADVARRLELLTLGSVKPECSLELAVKLCERFPIEFLLLTNKITRLTGMGADPVKSQPSGETPTSEG